MVSNPLVVIWVYICVVFTAMPCLPYLDEKTSRLASEALSLGKSGKTVSKLAGV